MRILPIKEVMDHVVCEFDHWDICLEGLIEIDGEYYYVKLIGLYGARERHGTELYEVHAVKWNDECTEYLRDYRQAYPHWFYVDGKCDKYTPHDMKWFGERWGGRNPIEEAALSQEMFEKHMNAAQHPIYLATEAGPL